MRGLSQGVSVVALMGGLLLGNAAVGQQRENPNRGDGPAGDREAQAAEGARIQRGGPVSDRFLSTWLIQDNRLEIGTSELAKDQAKHPQVKEFAGRMVEEHTALVGKLEKFAGRGARGEGGRAEAGQPRPGQDDARRAARTVANEVREEAAEEVRGVAQTVQEAAEEVQPEGGREGRRGDRGRFGEGSVLALRRELGQKMLESAKETLGHRQGSDFDIAYITMQVHAHENMLDTLQVFQTHVGPELHEVLVEAEKSTKEHLEHAKKLFETVDQQEN